MREAAEIEGVAAGSPPPPTGPLEPQNPLICRGFDARLPARPTLAYEIPAICGFFVS